MVKISVIIPVYNTEEYLSKCIESVINQDYDNLEVILVNDGSKDNSLKICKKYAEEDKRIVLIDKENTGVSDSRNRGLKIATGDYIAFVDSDDWIEPNMYSSMLESIIKTGADLCLSSYFIEYEDRSVIYKLKDDKDILEYSDLIDSVIPRIIGPNEIEISNNDIGGFIWRMLLSKNILDENNVFFKKSLPFKEDEVFLIEVLLNCKKVVLLDQPFYHYLKRSASAASNYRFNIQKEESLAVDSIIEALEKYGKDIEYKEKYKNNFDSRFLNFNSSLIFNEVKPNNTKKLKDKLKTLKEIYENKRLANLLEKLDTSEFTRFNKIRFYLMKKKKSALLYFFIKMYLGYMRRLRK